MEELGGYVKGLLCKDEDLSLDPQDPGTKQDMAIHTCKPTTREQTDPKSLTASKL